ncbi:hypothetical protein R5R35_007714 [Gryllus longicercus]|uniref:Uncharacterized protein n=1 Tax=Gryllus longicercus TaxID=2509291 RepID=A0AAN9Z118_9ORTH
MDSDNRKSRIPTFEETEKLLIKFNELNAEQEELIRLLDNLEKEVKQTNIDLDALRNVNEENFCYRIENDKVRILKAKEIIPTLEKEKLKKDKELDSLRKRIVEQNEEMVEFKKKYLKIPDSKDVPSTSNAEKP